MKTIVIDARELRTTTGRYVERLLNRLQEIDNDHNYIVLLYPKDMDGWNPTNKHFSKAACPYKEFTFAEQLGLLKQLHGIKPDLVHFTIVQQPILYMGKVVTTIQDLTTVRFRNPNKNWLIFTIKQKVYVWVNKIVARKSKALITPTEFVKDDIAKFARINSRKITVTYESADEILDNPEPIEELENEPFIMYVGRPLPHKNLYRLIASYADLKKSNPGLKLVLAGKKDSGYKRVEKWVEDREINGVIFTDFVSEGQLKWLYQKCQAYIFPSLSEGFGLPGLEAMRHGAPVVSSNATCLPELYGDAAYYFDPTDVDDMTKTINKVLKDTELRKKLISEGNKQYKKYSWTRMATQTLEVYKRVLEET
jgi:glycosyltransferase involved in cell wall biosynthesis